MSSTPIIDKVIEELEADGVEVNISHPHVRKNKKQFKKSNTYTLKNEFSSRKLIIRIKDLEENVYE